MPKRTDRQANANIGLPAAIRLLAREGLGAVTYRRVAAESGLSLSAVRNMWQTQATLVQRAAASLEDRLFRWPAEVGTSTDPSEYLRNCLVALLPFTPDQVEAHRAWLALRSAPGDSETQQIAARFEHERQTRVALALHNTDRKAGRGEPLQHARHTFAEFGAGDLTSRAGMALSAVAGLSDAMARPGQPLPVEVAERWLQALTRSLLD